MTLAMFILLRRNTSFARFGASCALMAGALYLDGCAIGLVHASFS